MKNILIIIFCLLLASLQLFYCHTLEPEYGELQVTLQWEDGTSNGTLKIPSASLPTQSVQNNDCSAPLKKAIQKKKNFSNSQLNTESVATDHEPVSVVRFSTQPGGIVEEFTNLASSYTIQLELGIYNILVEGLDGFDNVVYSIDTTKILVQTNQTTLLDLTMRPNFPTGSPEFVGLSPVNTNIFGSYILAWTSVAKATSYTLEEDLNSDFSSPVQIYTGNQTLYQVENKTNGSYHYRVRGENIVGTSSWSNPVTFEVTLTEYLMITTESLPNAELNEYYTANIEGFGGTLPYQWEIISGSLPSGLTSETNETFTILGTPTETGIFFITVRLTDNSPQIQSTTKAFTLNVLSAAEALQITTTSLSDGSIDSLYDERIYAEGGSNDRTWTITQGSLPDGLTLTDLNETAQISGTPTTEGTSTFTVTVTDNQYPDMADSASLEITIRPFTRDLILLTQQLSDGIVDETYDASIEADGGTLPYNWEIISGSLPPGLTGNPNQNYNITGVPTHIGSYDFNIQITDSSNPPLTITHPYSIHILPLQVTITTNSMPEGTVDQEYEAVVQAQGGTSPYTWEIIEGSLPPGLNTTSDGDLEISGIPSEWGDFPFTVQVIDNNTPPDTATKALSITIAPKNLTVKTSFLDEGRVGVAYEERIRADGGSGDRTWSITGGSLPPGLTFYDMGERAEVRGTPTAQGTYYFTVHVQDNVFTSMTSSKSMFIKIQGLHISTTSLPNVTSGVYYSKQLAAAGGVPPYTWSETASSAAHRSFNAFAEGIYIDASGRFKGTCHDWPATDQIEFKVQDSNSPPKTSTKTFNLTVLAGSLGIYDAELSDGTVGVPYTEHIIYRRGTPPLHSPWTISGDWPIPGLSVSYSNQNYHLTISGTPTTAGTYNFNVTIYDSSSPQKNRTDAYSITIDPP